MQQGGGEGQEREIRQSICYLRESTTKDPGRVPIGKRSRCVYPTVTSQDTYLQALEDMDSGIKGARGVVNAAQFDPSIPLGRLYICNTATAPIPSTVTLPHMPMQLDEPGPSQFP
jgi:hypothetical protein